MKRSEIKYCVLSKDVTVLPASTTATFILTSISLHFARAASITILACALLISAIFANDFVKFVAKNTKNRYAIVFKTVRELTKISDLFNICKKGEWNIIQLYPPIVII